MKPSHLSDEPATADSPFPVTPAAAVPDESTMVAASFSERVRLLIQRVGSATEIARMCGFSEGVVRSWRDGNSDPSRARCVTLARTLGVSLVWLVAGEGTILADAKASPREEQSSTEIRRSTEDEPGKAEASIPSTDRHRHMIDKARLEAAKRVLESGIELSGATLTPAEHADMLVSLYDIVGPSGTQIDAAALLAFNHRLAARAHPSPSHVA